MIWKKILLIFNPVSGRSQVRYNLMDIIETLSGAGYKVLCYATKGPGDARRVVREREDDYLYIACAGGDGTLDEVVSGMMESRDKPFVPIGYIPAGSTNDFATTLNIPSDMKKAAEVIASGRTFRCDLGKFNKKDYFIYVAAFGIFTGTSYQTPQELKNQLGHFAYILQGMSELGQMRSYRMHVKAIAEEEDESGKNTEERSGGVKSIRGGFSETKDINPVDSLFDFIFGTDAVTESKTASTAESAAGKGSDDKKARTAAAGTAAASNKDTVPDKNAALNKDTAPSKDAAPEKDASHNKDAALNKDASLNKAAAGKKSAGRVIDIEDDFAFGMVTNSRSIGGIPNITGTRVDLQDGLFEVTLIRMPKNPMEMSEILMVLGNTGIRSEMVRTFKTSRITFSSEEKTSWTRDGEFAGEYKRVTLENIPGQLRILVSEDYADRF